MEGLEGVCTREEGEKSQGPASEVATEREEVREHNRLSEFAKVDPGNDGEDWWT